MPKVFRIYSFRGLPCGAKELHGVAEFEQNCPRDVYEAVREQFRSQQPENVTYGYEVC